MAHDEVKRRLEAHRLPQLIREFLSHQWEAVLTAPIRNPAKQPGMEPSAGNHGRADMERGHQGSAG